MKHLLARVRSGPVTALDRLCINQMTVKQLAMPELVDACLELGVAGVGLWRDTGPVVRPGGDGQADPRRGPDRHHPVPRRLLHGDRPGRAGRGARRQPARDRRGGHPGHRHPGPGLRRPARRLQGPARRPGAHRRRAGASWARTPRAHGVRLAIEPLHPMYAADRCVVSTLAQALDLAERFPAEQVGVIVDTYHIWWDDNGARADRPGGRGRPYPLLPARRLDHPAARGRPHRPRQIGDGSIDMREWKGYVEAAGYTGPDRGRALQRRPVGTGRPRGTDGDGPALRRAHRLTRRLTHRLTRQLTIRAMGAR